ncbi:MAG: FtsW/RodA/SpoVE family cell cycle protein [Oscillospiraceae bacterium]|nr:FtsW/RodA/SpoVE family cell cycle protein [Oscillospiraceae bacterium]
MEEILQTVLQSHRDLGDMIIHILRYLAPLVALILMIRCIKPLLTFRKEPEIWGWLNMPDGTQIPITHWENVIGRSKSCDITIDFPTVSRNHAVLTRYDDGSWTISDAESKGGVLVNGKKVQICAVHSRSRISIGGVEMQLQPISQKQEARQAQLRTKAASGWDSVANLLLLTILQILMTLGFLLSGTETDLIPILQGFGGILACQWLLFGFYGMIHRASFEVETLAFFLCTMGMAAIATVKPQESMKQLIAMVLGVIIFLIIGWSLRDLERAKKVRYLATVAGVGFLVITLLFGTEYYGAKNWLIIGGMSLQPSELSKVCFVFAGASTMDRIMQKRNIIMFIAYSILICALLALMNDFGTALIFFCSFLIIAYLRSGSVGTVALAVTALIFAGVIALKIAPHALQRFATWRHVWEDPFNAGYQQCQALMCLASGGFFGLGAGRGRLQHVFAADSDIVFATISEEWGLIMAVLTVVCIVVFGFFAIRTAYMARSAFYCIGACTAAGVLVVQTILNCLGTLDILPFTGVPFPLLSNGGTSMMGAWGLLAFVKASDTRQNASFAVRLKGGKKA